MITNDKRKGSIRKRLFPSALLLLAVLLLALISPDAAVAGRARTISAGSAGSWPAVSARAVIVMDVSSGKVLYSKHPHWKMRPASLTKLMTAAVVLEHDHIHREVIVPGAALVGGSSMGLKAGEKLSIGQLLYGMLIPSGNDAATALAYAVGGTLPNFIRMMNAKARTLGMRESHFENPHGFDQPGHYTTASDLLKLTRYLYSKYPLFRDIVSTKDILVAGHWLHNRNELLETYPGVNGVKTGTTPGAGECLIVSAVYGTRQVMIVILGSRDRYADARALLDYYRAHYLASAAPSASSSAARRRKSIGFSRRTLVTRSFVIPYPR